MSLWGKGTCPVCGQRRELAFDKKMATHMRTVKGENSKKAATMLCLGTGKPPK